MSKVNTSTLIDDEKLKVIDIIIEMFPELKKSKDDIISNVFEKNGKPHKYIFTKISHKNRDLYIDPYGLILDTDLVFKGFVVDNKYYFEDDDIEIININKYDKIMNYNMKKSFY
jgi:hypothetical protein